MTALLPIKRCLLVGGLLILNGCSVLSYVGLYSFNDLDSLNYESKALRYPIAFDLVFILDEKMVSAFTQMSGPAWFSEKNAMLLKYAGHIQVVSLDVVANTPSTQITLPDKSADAYEIVLFANYADKAGQVAASLGKFETLTVIFNSDHYALDSGGDK